MAISGLFGDESNVQISSPQLVCSGFETPFHSAVFDSHARALFEETAGLAC